MPPVDFIAYSPERVRSTHAPASRAIRAALDSLPPPATPQVKVQVWASDSSVVSSNTGVKIDRPQLEEFVLSLLKDPTVQQVTVDLR